MSKWLMADCCVFCKCDVSKGTARAERLKLYGVLVERLGYATSIRMKLISILSLFRRSMQRESI